MGVDKYSYATVWKVSRAFEDQVEAFLDGQEEEDLAVARLGLFHSIAVNCYCGREEQEFFAAVLAFIADLRMLQKTIEASKKIRIV